MFKIVQEIVDNNKNTFIAYGKEIKKALYRFNEWDDVFNAMSRVEGFIDRCINYVIISHFHDSSESINDFNMRDEIPATLIDNKGNERTVFIDDRDIAFSMREMFFDLTEKYTGFTDIQNKLKTGELHVNKIQDT